MDFGCGRIFQPFPIYLIISSSKTRVWTHTQLLPPSKKKSHTTLQPTAKSKKAKGGEAKKALPPRRSKIWDDRVAKMSDHADLIVRIFSHWLSSQESRAFSLRFSKPGIIRIIRNIVQPQVCFSINLVSHLEDHPVQHPPGSCDSIESR